jgi:hypothetical protein
VSVNLISIQYIVDGFQCVQDPSAMGMYPQNLEGGGGTPQGSTPMQPPAGGPPGSGHSPVPGSSSGPPTAPAAARNPIAAAQQVAFRGRPMGAPSMPMGMRGRGGFVRGRGRGMYIPDGPGRSYHVEAMNI